MTSPQNVAKFGKFAEIQPTLAIFAEILRRRHESVMQFLQGDMKVLSNFAFVAIMFVDRSVVR